MLKVGQVVARFRSASHKFSNGLTDRVSAALRKRKENPNLRVVALLAVRNEELYIERCLRHLIENGIEVCVIDNESTDGTLDIVERFRGRGVFRVESYPHTGHFDSVGLLRRKEEMVREIEADWFIHHDADEIREPPPQYKTLRDAIIAVDAMGYNAIDFDEFVFVPSDQCGRYEGTDFVSRMRYYYYFRPRAHHRVNAWKAVSPVNLVESGGHTVGFEGRRIFPKSFVLRHYICLGLDHVNKKYGVERVYSQSEIVERGWHGKRIEIAANAIPRLPKRSAMKYLADGSRHLDQSDPKARHLLFEPLETDAAGPEPASASGAAASRTGSQLGER